MPRIRRWHRVSHDFNRDPEIIALRQKFGDWMGYAWLECLSIADRNNGRVPGTIDQIAFRLAAVSLQMYRGSAAKTVRKGLEFMQEMGWISVEIGWIQIVKYSEYHETRGQIKIPYRLDKTIHTKEEKIKIKSASRTRLTTTFPDDFKIDDPDLQEQFQAFSDYHKSKGSRFVDWSLAFKTWIRNSKRFNGHGTFKYVDKVEEARKAQRKRDWETLTSGLTQEEIQKMKERMQK